MKNRNFLILTFLTIVCYLFSCKYNKADNLTICDSNDIRFSTVIGPTIRANCAISGCHLGSPYIGDFSTYEGLKLRVDDGTFKLRVLDVHAMPPQKPLPSCYYDKLKEWVDAGALNN